MATKKPSTRSKKRGRSTDDIDLSELSMFDRAAKNIFSVLDNGYTDRSVLNAKDQKFRDILNRELEISKGYSQGSIVDFVHSIHLNQQNKNGKTPDKYPGNNDLFTQNINDIFSYYQDMYRNKFMEMDDLKFIAKFIPALGEAVKTVLDSIVSSDNIAETVNLNIKLPQGILKEDETVIRNEIERMENEINLRRKLKTIVYKNTLVTGTYYVYAVSYNRIFEEYDLIKKRENHDIKDQKALQFGNSTQTGKASEAYTYQLGDVNITPAMESIQSILATSTPVDGSRKKLDDTTIRNTMNEFYETLPEISCDMSTVYSDALESARTLNESEGVFEAFKAKVAKKAGKNSNETLKQNPLELTMPDGTKGEEYSGIRASKFNIPGTYVKFIPAKNVIPLKIFNQTVGYYLIHPKAKKNRNSAGEVTGINSIGNTLFSAVNVGEAKKHDAVQRVVDTISEGILNNFDKKFVTKNAEYKKLISDVIIANGLTDKDYNIQFIPEGDLIPFTIQENEEGFGESILTDSLFPAKLLLSMIVTRMLNYINKTGNKTIAHIHRGPVNAFDSNQLNRIIRELQESDVTFNDLLSPNLVFNKFNRDGNLAIPTTRDDKRLVEFETQEGQNIDMSPEYEKELENMAILGTGVPSVIMEYTSSADFAKQLVSANIKFAGRVATLQGDLEGPTTILYKKLVENSNLTEQQKTICAQSLEITLPRPRVLTNSNNSEYVSNIVQVADAIADVVLGRDTTTDSNSNPNGLRYKEKLMEKIVKKNAPFIDWDEIIAMKEDSILEVEGEIARKAKPEDENGSSGEGNQNPF